MQKSKFRLKVREVEAIQWNKPGDAAIVQERRCQVVYQIDGREIPILVGNSMDALLEQMKAEIAKDETGVFVARCEDPINNFELDADSSEDPSKFDESEVYRFVGEVFAQPKSFVMNTGREFLDVHPGDWIIKDADNNLTVMRNEDFRVAFEPV